MAEYPLDVTLLVTLAICCLSSASARRAAAPVPAPSNSEAREYLEPHNQARAVVGVGPLKWNESMAKAATRVVSHQRDNKRCDLAEDAGSLSGSNSNQFWSVVRSRPVTPRLAVESWVAEKQYYNHDNNSCVQNHECHSYTQVVWRNSSELGCAEATCIKEQTSLTLCFYNPPGNYQGQIPY